MLKRICISSSLIILLIIILGFAKGFVNLPMFLPLLPPLVAIALAFITYEVVLSLFVGIVLGSIITIKPIGFIASVVSNFTGTLKSVDTYMVNALADSDHMSIILFTIFTGGLISLVARSGGLQGIVITLSKYAKNSVMTQFYTWLMGLFIFFDDYANSLIVGNTMRPLSDKYKISREKLSFIVDATAAPVTSLVIISTWIGYEVGLIQDIFKITGIAHDPYMTFIYSIPFRFYVILMLIFIPMLIFLRRDFGPMLDAENRARSTGEVLRKGSTPMAGEEYEDVKLAKGIVPRSINAIFPIGFFIISVIVGIYLTGYMSTAAAEGFIPGSFPPLKIILGASNSFKALIWASFLSSVVAMIMFSFQKIMTFQDALKSWFNGFKSMTTALIILTLAWSLGSVLKDIKTATVVTELLKGVLSYHYLPILVFFIAAITSFATGTSWGTMAILFPIVVPLSHQLTGGAPESMLIMQASIGAILSGAVFGDHCSPISDTTILSSIASNVDHMDHVKTQLPYALTVGGISCIVGYLPIGFGFNPYISIIIGIGLMFGTLYIFGKKVATIE